MARTIIRIGEYYENKNKTFKNHKPTFRQFLKWYKDSVDSRLYTSYYQGLSIPGIYISNFVRDHKKKEYSIKEKEFINELSSIVGKQDVKRSLKYVVILCSKGKRSSVYKHELAHSLGYLYRGFYKKINRLINKIDPCEYQKMKNFLIKYRYPEDEINEEIFCRLIENMSLDTLFRNSNVKLAKKTITQLRLLFEDYAEKIK